MNFDRPNPNPLSNYSPAEADWGIEESLPTRHFPVSATPTDLSHNLRYNDFNYPPFHHPLATPTFTNSSFNDRASSHNNNHLRSRNNLLHHSDHLVVLSTTQNFHKFIEKYLNLNQKDVAIIERFKYNLVVSNLLDASMVLSKNEQALSSLIKLQKDVYSSLQYHIAKRFSSDGAYLIIKDRQYSLVFPQLYTNPLVLMHVIALTIFLIKQFAHIRSNLRYSSRVTLFKFLLVVATRIIKFKRAALSITASRGLRRLDDFMIRNCMMNKVLITAIISLKEYDMFSFLNKAAKSSEAARFSSDLKVHLNTILISLLLNIRYSISSLLPMCNGPLLEQYCDINGIQVGNLTVSDSHLSSFEDGPLTLDTLTEKLNCFNNLRRFFICQLLTVHDAPLRNFFILKLYDSFKVQGIEKPFLRISERLTVMDAIFSEHTAFIDQLLSLNDKFKYLTSAPSTADFANDDVLSSSIKQNRADGSTALSIPPDHDVNLDKLIDKLTDLTTSLRYFKKYSQAISNIDDADECEEKISIFSLFESELASCGDMFRGCVDDYKDDFAKKFSPWTSHSEPSTRSNSQRNLLKASEQFSPKSFHTTMSKKSDDSSDRRPSSEGKHRRKKLSNGLQLNLLTVLEEADQNYSHRTEHFRARARGHNDSSADDPRLSSSSHGSYNQAAFEALTRKVNMRGSLGRYSSLSMNSNVSGISDLIASTQATGDEDDGEISKTSLLSGPTPPPGMSKEDLKKRLEESFTRIYSLENENSVLKLKGIPDPTDDDHDDDHETPLTPSDTMAERTLSANPKFLESLEKSLNSKPIL